MSGLASTAQVRRIKSDPELRKIPVMIVSYKDREEDRRRGLDAVLLGSVAQKVLTLASVPVFVIK